jgi:ATP-dependent Zn protease
MKRYFLILFVGVIAHLQATEPKESWLRSLRHLLNPFMSELNKANWDRLIAQAENDSFSTPYEQSFGDNALLFRQDPFQENNYQQSTATFSDIAGGVPQEIHELYQLLTNAHYYRDYGISIPKGILMVGPPGTGKTLLARALAGELNSGFFTTSASEFIELYGGSGPLKIREIFKKAATYSRQHHGKKVIIFIDELDALGNRSSVAPEDSETRRTINELLVQLDGFASNDALIILAATNNPQHLDVALKRPGRFDTIVEIPLPDHNKREAILRHYYSKIPKKHHDTQANLSMIKAAEVTKGFNNADLKEVIRLATLQAAREHSSTVNSGHIEGAISVVKKQKKF